MKQTNKDRYTTIIKAYKTNNSQTIAVKANRIFEIKGSLKVTYVTLMQYKANKKKCMIIKIHKKRTYIRNL